MACTDGAHRLRAPLMSPDAVVVVAATTQPRSIRRGCRARRATMAAGTSPPRVMRTRWPSNGPLSASRQASARASRWNWSQETGRTCEEAGWDHRCNRAAERRVTAVGWRSLRGQANARRRLPTPMCRSCRKADGQPLFHVSKKAAIPRGRRAADRIAQGHGSSLAMAIDRRLHEGSVHDPPIRIRKARRLACAVAIWPGVARQQQRRRR